MEYFRDVSEVRAWPADPEACRVLRGYLEELAAGSDRPVVLSTDSLDMRGADLSGMDLSGAFFHDTNLAGVHLSGACLLHAYFFNSNDLSGADFSRACLRKVEAVDALARGADFSGADLTRADLMYADLRGVDFRDAFLWSVLLTWADLRDADLRGARLEGSLDGARLAGARLEGACGSVTGDVYVDGSGERLSGTRLTEWFERHGAPGLRAAGERTD